MKILDQWYAVLTILCSLWTMVYSLNDEYSDVLIKDSTDFKEVTAGVFVDKTRLIEEFMSKRYVMVTCPQGFGKSLNLNMIKRFLELPLNRSTGKILPRNETENYLLFTNETLSLKIYENRIFFNNHFGVWPIIYVNLTIDRCSCYEDASQQVHKKLADCFADWYWLFSQNKVNVTLEERRFYDCVVNWMSPLCENIENYLKKSLTFLARIIRREYNKKVILLIDDFDSSMKRMMEINGDLKGVFELVDGLLTATFSCHEYDPSIYRGLVYGTFTTLRALKNTNLKVLDHYMFLGNHAFSKYHIFSLTDVETTYFRSVMLTPFDKRKLRNYYYGYLFSRKDHCCGYAPTDVVKFFKNIVSQRPVVEDEKKRYYFQFKELINFYELVKNPFLREYFMDMMWFRGVHFLCITSITVETLQMLTRMLHTKGSNRSEDCYQILPYLYEAGMMTPTDNENIFKAANGEIRNELRFHVANYYMSHLSAETKAISSKIYTSIQNLMNSDGDHTDRTELLILENTLNFFFQEFDNVSKTFYDFQAHETDFRALLYLKLWKVGRDSKWKQPAIFLRSNNTNPGRTRVDIVLKNDEQVLLMIKLKHKSTPYSYDIDLVRPLATDARATKKLKLMLIKVRPDLTVQIKYIPSVEFNCDHRLMKYTRNRY